MLMIGTRESTIRHDHLLHLHQFLKQIELEEYYSLIVEKLKVRDRICKKSTRRKQARRERERERETIKINQQ